MSNTDYQSTHISDLSDGEIDNLTIDDIVNCWNTQYQTCAYSGIEMTLEAGQLNTVSIERINSDIGYTKDNTILVCQAINRMKSDFKYDDFYNQIQWVRVFLFCNFSK